MWLAGLRGAMAYALALESHRDYGVIGKVMLVITLIYSLFSVLFIGSILSPLLSYIGVEKSDEDLRTQIAEDESFYGDSSVQLSLNWGERFKNAIYNINLKYIRPIFVVKQEEAEIVADKTDEHETVLPYKKEESKRKSDSQLFEINLDGNELKLNRLKKINLSDTDIRSNNSH